VSDRSAAPRHSTGSLQGGGGGIPGLAQESVRNIPISFHEDAESKMRQEVHKLLAEVSVKNVRIAALEGEEQETMFLRSEVSARDARLAGLEGSLHETRELQSAVSVRDVRIAMLQGAQHEASELHAQVLARDARIVALEGVNMQARELQSELSTRDLRIANLECVWHKSSELHTELSSKDVRIAVLEASVDELRNAATGSAQHKSDLALDVSQELQQKVFSRDQQIEQLEASVRDMRHAAMSAAQEACEFRTELSTRDACIAALGPVEQERWLYREESRELKALNTARLAKISDLEAEVTDVSKDNLCRAEELEEKYRRHAQANARLEAMERERMLGLANANNEKIALERTELVHERDCAELRWVCEELRAAVADNAELAREAFENKRKALAQEQQSQETIAVLESQIHMFKLRSQADGETNTHLREELTQSQLIVSDELRSVAKMPRVTITTMPTVSTTLGSSFSSQPTTPVEFGSKSAEVQPSPSTTTSTASLHGLVPPPRPIPRSREGSVLLKPAGRAAESGARQSLATPCHASADTLPRQSLPSQRSSGPRHASANILRRYSLPECSNSPPPPACPLVCGADAATAADGTGDAAAGSARSGVAMAAAAAEALIKRVRVLNECQAVYEPLPTGPTRADTPESSRTTSPQRSMPSMPRPPVPRQCSSPQRFDRVAATTAMSVVKSMSSDKTSPNSVTQHGAAAKTAKALAAAISGGGGEGRPARGVPQGPSASLKEEGHVLQQHAGSLKLPHKATQHARMCASSSGGSLTLAQPGMLSFCSSQQCSTAVRAASPQSGAPNHQTKGTIPPSARRSMCRAISPRAAG